MSTHTIQRKLTAVGTCGSLIILESLTDGTPINLHFATGSTYDASYLSINEINATGDQAVFLVATEGSLDVDNTYPSTGWNFTSNQPARTLYWVGDGGNWGDESHWVTRDANGAIKTTNECTPTPKDIVIFDANSFTTMGQKVTMDLVVATCHSIIWKDDVKFQPEWAGDKHNHILRVYSSLTTTDASKMSVSYQGHVYMLGSGNIDTKGNELTMGKWFFENEQASWNLSSDWHARQVYFNRGNLKSNNYAMNLSIFIAISEKNASLDLGTSSVKIRGNHNIYSWRVSNAQNKFTLSAVQSTIALVEDAIEMQAGTGLVYNNLTFSNNKSNGVKLSANQSSFNDVLFKSSTITVAGNNNMFRALTLMKGGTIEGDNTFDYLTLVQGESYFMGGGKTHAVNKRLMVRGNNCSPIQWESTSASQAASIVMGTNAIAIVRYVNMQGLHITEKTPKFEAIQCADNGINAGWNFVPLNQAVGHGFADSQTINPGEEVCLSVENFAVMEGDDFVWLKDGVEINNTSRTLCISEAGTYTLKITYDNGCETQDEIVISYPVSQCPYQIGNATFSCVGDTVCVWLKAKTDVTAGIIGMDYCLQYDASVVEPITDLNLPKDRRYEFGEVVTTNGQGFEDVYINYEAGQNRVYSSIFYRDAQNATNPRYFTGSGNVICIKFRLKTAVTGQFPITACQVSESYALGEEDKCADPGMVEVTPDVNKLKARIIYWNQEGGVRPLAYDNSGNHLITNIHGNVATCDTLSATVVNTDTQGYFVYDKTQGSHVTIKRDIPGDYNGQTGTAPDMMNVVNGMDCYYAGLITTFDQNNTNNGNSNWTPNAFQMLAADVNMNDKVRANDITLIQNRIVLKMQEYPQVWNYAYTAGNTGQQPTQAGVYSLDWRFVDETTVNTAVDFNATANYPVFVGNTANDAGFWRDNAPDLTTCRPVQEGSVCDTGNTNNLFYGIMLGDVDGSWTTGVSNHLRTTKSEGTLAIDLFNAEQMGDGVYRVPVYYRGEGKLHAIDFSFEYDNSKLQVQKADYATAGTNAEMKMRWNAYQNQKFLLTSYTMKGVNTQDKVYYIEVKTTDGNLDANAFQNVKAYLNGKASKSRVIATAAQQNAFAMANNTTVVTMYPNPASNVVTLSYSHISQGTPQVVLSDLNGQKVNIQPTIDQSGKIQFGVSHVVRGLYLVTLYDEAGGVISRQKLMIKR
ncbi:T9SS type A sorting domain-containing protein [uncultured Microscilla sp.]|uniref:T9SS type A sorting domain-containing protein n=1 Tax=uncultured Microscilla sp. TaxID=432653 RepID=UPI002630BC8C|nr:T9SS type A sorting domain-containing protein [uncultured Microscilla sp.]